MTLPPASSFADTRESEDALPRLGLGGELHVWNVRLCAIAYRPDLYFRIDEGGHIALERYLNDDDPFEMDPPVLAEGATFAECWDKFREASAEATAPRSGGDGATSYRGAASERPSPSAHDRITSRPAPPASRTTAPHAATRAAAGGHGRPRRLEQQELPL